MYNKSYQLAPLLAGLIYAGTCFGFVTLEVCYDFGCKNRSMVTLDRSEWDSVEKLLDAQNPRDERKQIKHAIARMETLIGQYTPLHKDLGMNLPITDAAESSDLFPGQLDCIDESINTTRYLQLMQQRGLLRFHSVLKRAYRRSFITQHWAAQIIDHQSGQKFVIDSWFEKNGEPPVLVSSERWHDLSL